MAFDLFTIRSRIATDVAGVIDGEDYPTWPDNPHPPCVIVQPSTANYHLAMGKGLMEVPLDVVLLVSSVVSDEAQRELDSWLSSGTGMSKSVIDTLQHNTLSGACSDLHVLGFSDYGAVEMGDERRFFGAVLNTVVYCDRK